MKELNQDYVKLLPPQIEGGPGLYSVLKVRRTYRHYLDKEITFEQLSQLLWCADGINDEKIRFRTSPSGFAAFPMELYILTKEGFFHYNVMEHALERRIEGNMIAEIEKEKAAMSMITKAPLIVLILSVVDRFKRFKFSPEHTGPFLPKDDWYASAAVSLMQESGHICQNLILAAAGYGMTGVAASNCHKTKLRKMLRWDDEPWEISDLHYIVPIAYPDMTRARPLTKNWEEVDKMSIPEFKTIFWKEGEGPDKR